MTKNKFLTISNSLNTDNKSGSIYNSTILPPLIPSTKGRAKRFMPLLQRGLGRSITIFAPLFLILFTTALSANDDIMNAMRDEIKRSMDELKLENLKRPYFVEYTLSVTHSRQIKSELGAISETADNKYAQLTVGVRVGDYKFDNTNFFDIGLSFFGSGDDEERFKKRNIPIEIDYDMLRRELWLATDAAYKQTAEIFSKKEATIKNRMRMDTTHDFMQVQPSKHIDTVSAPDFDFETYKTICNKLSAVFRDYPQIYLSGVGMEYIPKTIYYVNSEGTEYIKSEMMAGLEIVGISQSDDGMPSSDFYTAYADNPSEFPSEDSLMRAAKTVADKLSKILKADYLYEPYSGPILFEGRAAAEIFAQVFAPNLVAQRPPLTENGTQDGGRYSAFQTKIGGRVLPEFMSIEALPNTKELERTKLMGYYKIDDDGIMAKDVPLVKDGYLKNLLSERIPTRRVRGTNGHKRGGSAMLSNIVVSADEEHSKTDAELKERMMQLCKDRELPYGLIVRKVLNQNLMFTTFFRMTGGEYPTPVGQNKLALTELYKIYPDGREEIVRTSVGNGFTVQSFKDIILAGKNRYAMNYLAPAVVSPFVTGGDQYVVSSLVTPDILFEDGEIKPWEDDFPKPPLIGSPLEK